jgi:hypothetical protein
LTSIRHLAGAASRVREEVSEVRLRPVDDAHRALRDEIFRRLEAARDDENVTNTDGSNYWGPRITKAVKDREDDGPALVKYVKSVLRKTGESEGWHALLEADRLELSFEEAAVVVVLRIGGRGYADPQNAATNTSTRGESGRFRRLSRVGDTGLEPVTSALSRRRSPS